MAALPETLKSITATKIEELKKQRKNFEAAKIEIVSQASKENALTSKVGAVLDGSCRLEGVRTTDTSDDEYGSSSLTGARLKNQQLFLRQAKADPSFSQSIVRQIGEDLSRDLALKSLKHEHAQFFSELVTEWLSNPDNQLKEPSSDEPGADSSYETLGRKEMHEQRAQWEKLVFSNIDVKQATMAKYLESLFTSSKPITAALEQLRKEIRNFSTTLELNADLFDLPSLKTTIKGLVATDLLSEEKAAILKTFLANKEVLREVADVLNMRAISLDTWSWSTTKGGIPVEMRKQLNGKYRVFMDEDVLDGLLLHALGMKWAVQFKASFTTFFNSHAWKRSSKNIPKADRERREYFLGRDLENDGDTVDSKRRLTYGADYFMTQLPVEESEGTRAYDGSDSDDDPQYTERKSPLEIKHSLLHLLTTESLLALHLHPDRTHTIVRSDFKWFGPSLPHDSIYAVLEFFGVSEYWLSFFRRFLEAPLRFVQDGPESQIQVRQRGVPMSHALSDVFGEATLFVMDFAVNQATDGSYLYRLHDDFWFWGQDDACKRAWSAMSVFATTIGIKFNEEKTGTVRLSAGAGSHRAPGHSRTNSKPESSDYSTMEPTRNKRLSLQVGASNAGILPKGDIRWGFLRLDDSTGRFVVDQRMVDDHIEELKVQLSSCNSVFSYIQAYNAYLARFFSNNFGKPSYAFGRDHIDMMISTFARIQKSLFPKGSVTDHLRVVIEEKFDVKDLPDGFFYWPIQMGGLELRNPFVPLFAMRVSLRRTPDRMLQKALDKDEAAFTNAQASFQRGNTGNGLGKYNAELSRKIESAGGHFMSKEEFLKYREERSIHLAGVYEQLLTVPNEHEVEQTPQISSWLENLPDSQGRKAGGIQKRFKNMQPYWKWTLAVHGGEIVKRYGSVRIADEGSVPIGVVGVMKAGKVRWKG